LSPASALLLAARTPITSAAKSVFMKRFIVFLP
jgi:hypothetical protein